MTMRCGKCGNGERFDAHLACDVEVMVDGCHEEISSPSIREVHGGSYRCAVCESDEVFDVRENLNGKEEWRAVN